MFFDALLHFVATAVVVIAMFLGCLTLLLTVQQTPHRRRTKPWQRRR